MNKITVDVKHSKIHQGVIIDMIVHVLLATWRKLMRLGINHDKNKSKLPKLVVRINNLLLVLNRANNTSKLPKLVDRAKVSDLSMR